MLICSGIHKISSGSWESIDKETGGKEAMGIFLIRLVNYKMHSGIFCTRIQILNRWIFFIGFVGSESSYFLPMMQNWIACIGIRFVFFVFFKKNQSNIPLVSVIHHDDYLKLIILLELGDRFLLHIADSSLICSSTHSNAPMFSSHFYPCLMVVHFKGLNQNIMQLF